MKIKNLEEILFWIPTTKYKRKGVLSVWNLGERAFSISTTKNFSQLNYPIVNAITKKTKKELTFVNLASSIQNETEPMNIAFPEFLFRGCLFTSVSEIIFESILIEFDRLDEWTGSFLRKKENLRPPTRIRSKEFTLRGNIGIQFEERWKKIGKIRYKKSYFLAHYSSEDYYKKMYVRIFPKGKDFIFIWKNVICPLQELFSLFFILREPFYIYSLQGLKCNKKIDLLLTKQRWQDTIPNGFLCEYKFFDFNFLINNFEHICNNWLTNYHRLKDILSLFLYRYPDYEQKPEDQVTHDIPSLLFNAQVLETLHRRFFNKDFISKEIWTPLKGKLIKEIEHADLTQKQKENLKNKLGYFQELSLKGRLEDIYVKFQPILKERISQSDYHKIVTLLVNTRNQYTHFSGTRLYLQDNHEKAFFQLLEFMEFLIRLLVLGILIPDQMEQALSSGQYANHSYPRIDKILEYLKGIEKKKI